MTGQAVFIPHFWGLNRDRFQRLQKGNSDNVGDFIEEVIPRKRSIERILSFQLSSGKRTSRLTLRSAKHDFVTELFVLVVAGVVVADGARGSVFSKECD